MAETGSLDRHRRAEIGVAAVASTAAHVTEVREGYECGIGLGYNDIHIGDVIETYEMREVPRA